MENQEKRVKLALNLNEELLAFALQRLAQFRTEHPSCAENVVCDLPQLNRDLCNAVGQHLNMLQVYGMKKRTAEICCISLRTQYNYEHFVPL